MNFMMFLILSGFVPLVYSRSSSPHQNIRKRDVDKIDALIDKANEFVDEIVNNKALAELTSTDIWFPVTQILIDGLLVLGIINTIYIYVVPIAIGQVHINRVFDYSWKETLSSAFGSFVSSFDPVDLSLRYMRVYDEPCKERTICQLRKRLAFVPLIQGYVNSYAPAITGMKKYQRALDLGEAFEDCYAAFPECKY